MSSGLDVSHPEHEPVHTFPFGRPDYRVAAEYSALQARGGLSRVRLWNGETTWLASRYHDVRQILGDDRFSAGTHHPHYPSVSETRKAIKRTEPPNLLQLDPPEHTRLRRMLAPEFGPARLKQMRAAAADVVDQLISDMQAKGPPADIVADFALPLPSFVIARVLGVPYEDHDFFQDRTLTKITLDVPAEVAIQAGEDQRQYVRDLLVRKSGNPEAHDDLCGRLLAGYINTGELSLDDAVAMIDLLLVAGHETTANMISLGTLSLIQQPEICKAIALDATGGTITRVVEELLRFHAIVQFTASRVALTDVAIGSQTIAAGLGVLALCSPANHDTTVFAQPDLIDIERSLTPAHVAFGYGIHQCLGQGLARVELAVVFRELVRRMPGLKLSGDFGELVFKGNSMVHGLKNLPVTW